MDVLKTITIEELEKQLKDVPIHLEHRIKGLKIYGC